MIFLRNTVWGSGNRDHHVPPFLKVSICGLWVMPSIIRGFLSHLSGKVQVFSQIELAITIGVGSLERVILRSLHLLNPIWISHHLSHFSLVRILLLLGKSSLSLVVPCHDLSELLLVCLCHLESKVNYFITVYPNMN